MTQEQGSLIPMPASPADHFADGGDFGRSLRVRTSRRLPWLWIALALFIGTPAGYFLWNRLHGKSAAELSRECFDLTTEGKWDEAVKLAAQWTALEPQSGDSWLMRAKAAEVLKDWPHVVEYLDRIPRSDSRALGALVRKAIIEFENLNRPRAGVKTCDEVLKMDPRVLLVHKQIIFFYAITLERAEMVRRIREAIRVGRESPESYVFLFGSSWLYPGSVYRHNSHWLESTPEDETFEVARALQVYVSEAKTDLQSAADFEHIPPPEKLLEKYPHNLELVAYFLNRGISDGDLDRVRELLDAVSPDIANADARFWRARAWCADVTGDFESAEQALRRAFELDPYWWQIHFQLHDLLRRRGRADESAKYHEIYRISKALTTEIKSQATSLEGLNNRKFLESLLKLSEFAKDNLVTSALKERIPAL